MKTETLFIPSRQHAYETKDGSVALTEDHACEVCAAAREVAVDYFTRVGNHPLVVQLASTKARSSDDRWEDLPRNAFAMHIFFLVELPHEASAVVMAGIRSYAEQCNALLYIAMFEGWLVPQPTDEELRSMRASENPRREEHIVVISEHATLGNSMHTAKIVREPSLHLEAFVQWPGADNGFGTLSGVLPRPKVNA